MPRALSDVINSLPTDRRQRVETRYAELRDTVDGLAQLRIAAGKTQGSVASMLAVKQPSISKLERQADMYLSTLRSYVQAIGGELELVVRLPARPPFKLERLGDVAIEGRSKPGRRAKIV